MASRLYGTTRRLYTEVMRALQQLGIADIGSPTMAVLVLYVTGLIFLDVRQTQTRVTRFLPGRCQYIAFDTHYTAGWFTKMLGRLGLTWVGTLHPRTTVVYRGHRWAVSQLADQLRLKWRENLGLRAVALRVYAPKYGLLRLVVTRNRHGNGEYLVSNDLGADLSTLVLRKRSRWSIETIGRDSRQYAGLAACPCWVDQAMVRHVGFVLLTFVVLQRLPVHPDDTVAALKERRQLEAIRSGEAPPAPLKACPSHLRATA